MRVYCGRILVILDIHEGFAKNKLTKTCFSKMRFSKGDESFLSRFQVAVDTIFATKNIYLIICGSAVSFMEKEILSEKSPLFGRRTNQIFLRPFDYLESAEFVPKYSAEDKAVVYGVTGGVANQALMARRGLIDKRYEEVEFMLFSLTGFSKWVKENADPEMVRLVTLKELYD